MRRMPIETVSLEVNKSLPTQYACGVFWLPPSKVTGLFAIALNQWPKSHQEVMMAEELLLSRICAKPSHHPSFMAETEPSAIANAVRVGVMIRITSKQKRTIRRKIGLTR